MKYLKSFLIIILSFLCFACSNKVEEKYPNGTLKSTGDKIENKMQGLWKFYWENGKLKAEGFYENGDGSNLSEIGIPINGRDSIWKFYFENGKPDVVETYKNNKIISGFYYKENGEELGEELEVHNNILYYTKSIKKDFAKNFVDYLIKTGIFLKNEDSSGLQAQIDKVGKTYTISMVSKEGVENDNENILTIKSLAKRWSLEFFNGQNVDIALVDNKFNKKKVVFY